MTRTPYYTMPWPSPFDRAPKRNNADRRPKRKPKHEENGQRRRHKLDPAGQSTGPGGRRSTSVEGYTRTITLKDGSTRTVRVSGHQRNID